MTAAWMVAAVLNGCTVLARLTATALVELADLVWGIGDTPDQRPGTPTALDREYFALLDSESTQ